MKPTLDHEKQKAEIGKLQAEANKFEAEAAKLRRESRWGLVVQVAIPVLTACLAVLLPEALKAFR